MFTDLFQEVAGYIDAGGWVMPPLLIATLVLWFAIGYRFAALKRGTHRDVRNLIRRYEKGKVSKSNGVMVRALRKGMQLRAAGLDDLRPHLDSAFFEEQKEIRKYSRLIMTIVAAALANTFVSKTTFMTRRRRRLHRSGIHGPPRRA